MPDTYGGQYDPAERLCETGGGGGGDCAINTLSNKCEIFIRLLECFKC